MHVRNRSQTSARPPRLRRTLATACLAILAFGVLALPALGQDGGCTESHKNVQCGEMGAISMDSQRDIRGEALDITAEIILNTNMAEHDARWFLFSVRNVTDDGTNPVTIQLTRFATDAGDIVTTRVDHDTANELDLWVDGLDIPVGQPIHLQMTVGCTDRGAYRLETLVMAFDRGYDPVSDSSGNQASLFSFTLLGVNKETGAVSVDGGGVADGHKLPSPMVPILGAEVLAVAAVLRRRNGA